MLECQGTHADFTRTDNSGALICAELICAGAGAKDTSYGYLLRNSSENIKKIESSDIGRVCHEADLALLSCNFPTDL